MQQLRTSQKDAGACLGLFVVWWLQVKTKMAKWKMRALKKGLSQKSHVPECPTCICRTRTLDSQTHKVAGFPNVLSFLFPCCPLFFWRQLWFFHTLSGSMPGGDTFRCDVIALRVPGSRPFKVLCSIINISTWCDQYTINTNKWWP